MFVGFYGDCITREDVVGDLEDVTTEGTMAGKG